MNFKHFIIVMKAEDIFKQYNLPEETAGHITFEDLKEGLTQLALPILKPIAGKCEVEKS
jgi:hypothetical protein